MKTGVGTSTYLLDSQPFDPAQGLGPLQEKIFEILSDDCKLPKEDKDFIIKIYYSYQSGTRMSRKMAGIICRMYKKHEAIENEIRQKEYEKQIAIEKAERAAKRAERKAAKIAREAQLAIPNVPDKPNN